MEVLHYLHSFQNAQLHLISWTLGALPMVRLQKVNIGVDEAIQHVTN